jgi:hypothetical protein
MSARPSDNNNPAGVGGFADRPWDRWRPSRNLRNG